MDESNEILIFDFLYVKIALGRDILPLEQCMKYSGHYISSLPSDINYIIGTYITTTLLKQFRRRHPTVFYDHLRLFAEKLISSSSINITYEEFAKVIKFFLTQDDLDEEIAINMPVVLHIRPVLLYVCKYIHGTYLLATSNILKDDYEIVMAAVSSDNYGAIEHASKRLLDNEDIILSALKKNKKALFYASDRIKDDEKIVLRAVAVNGYSLKFASARLRDKEDVVIAAIKRHAKSCRYMSERLQHQDNMAIYNAFDDDALLNFNGEEPNWISHQSFKILMNIHKAASMILGE